MASRNVTNRVGFLYKFANETVGERVVLILQLLADWFVFTVEGDRQFRIQWSDVRKQPLLGLQKQCDAIDFSSFLMSTGFLAIYEHRSVTLILGYYEPANPALHVSLVFPQIETERND